MKTVSIFLTASLLMPIAACLLAVFQTYYQLNSDFIPKSAVVSITKPFIIYGISYFVFLVISLYLNIKKKYLVTIILSACLMMFYLVTVNFIGFTWLE
jgi:hypothetical protein